MQTDMFDYRNGKYQGSTNQIKQRNGLGILIDDDLAFHISHWVNNKLHGPTLVYLTHGKYIYGQWKMNEPHGLNIYRSGETVLLSKFKHGIPSQRCLLIFEKYNFACVLTDQNGEWKVVQSGPVPNHKMLMKYIDEIGLPFPQHYFSLTKFACTFSNNGKIKIFPCKANLCYFGFVNGLGIIFNSNNGVVSVGHHQNQQLCQFGGQYSGLRKAEEGNFQTGEVVSYVGQRPTTKIHAIFQQMHKKGLNFCNEYFDPKTKVFKTIQDILQNKLSEIAQQGRKIKQFNYLDLNDSLNYKEYDDQQSFKMNENRQKMYSPPKKSIQRNHNNPQKGTNSYIPQPLSSTQDNTNVYKYNNFNATIKSPIKQSKYRQKQLYQKSNNDPNTTNNPKQQPSFVPKYKPQQEKYQMRKNEEPKKSYEDRGVKRINQLRKSETNPQFFYDAKQSLKEQDEQKQRFQELTFQNIIIPASNHNYSQNNKRFVLNQNGQKGERAKQRKFEFSKFQGLNEQKTNGFQKEHENLKQTTNFQKKGLKNLTSQYKEIQGQDLQRPREVSISPGNTIRKESNIKRPTYEEIQERRKRLLRDFKQLNETKQSSKKISQFQESPVKISEGMAQNHSRQSSCGFIPLSISNKLNEKGIKAEENMIKQPKKAQKLKQISTISQQAPKAQKTNNSQNAVVRSNRPYPLQQKQLKGDKQNQTKIQPTKRSNQPSQHNLTPSKQKRTYQYMFD